jgi:hypothetical protein
MSHPVPVKLREKFTKHMEAHDFDDLPYGAWFHCLEQAAQEFLNKYNLTKPWHCANTATHRYLKGKNG